MMNQIPDYTRYVPFMGRDYNLFMLVGLALTAIFKARHKQVKHLGLTPAEFHLLLLVSELGESAFPAEISRWMMRKPPTVSRLLDRMERNTLVRRTKPSGNSKIRRIVMTRKGREALEKARSPDVLALIVDALSEDEFRLLWHLLEKLKDTALLQAREMEVVRESVR